MGEMRKYECESYSVDAPARSCLFCACCTDVFWDYTNAPYMFICGDGRDTMMGALGVCDWFVEELEDE